MQMVELYLKMCLDEEVACSTLHHQDPYSILPIPPPFFIRMVHFGVTPGASFLSLTQYLVLIWSPSLVWPGYGSALILQFTSTLM